MQAAAEAGSHFDFPNEEDVMGSYEDLTGPDDGQSEIPLFDEAEQDLHNVSPILPVHNADEVDEDLLSLDSTPSTLERPALMDTLEQPAPGFVCWASVHGPRK